MRLDRSVRLVLQFVKEMKGHADFRVPIEQFSCIRFLSYTSS